MQMILMPIFQAFLSRHVDGIIWAVPEVGENRDWLNNPPARPGSSDCLSDHGAADKISRWFPSTIIWAGEWRWRICSSRVSAILGISPVRWIGGRHGSAWRPGKMPCKKLGLEVNENHWVEGNWSSASGAQAIEKLFQPISGNGCDFCRQTTRWH